RVRNNNETGLNQFLPLSLSLKRILDMEMRMTGLETTTDAVKVDLLALKADFKEEITATRSTFNMILQALHSQVSLHAASVTPTTQPQAQPGTTTQQYDFESRLEIVFKARVSRPRVRYCMHNLFVSGQTYMYPLKRVKKDNLIINTKVEREAKGQEDQLSDLYSSRCYIFLEALIHQTRFLGLNLHVGCSVDRPLHQFAFVIAGDPSCLSLVLVEKSGSDACSGAFIDRWAIGHLV
ncbi:unnamed protein product, partial [Brassica rapa subsp. trilocularis]